MKFWDTSALMPLLNAEPATPVVSGIVSEYPDIVVWQLTSVEIASAIWRRWRETREEMPAHDAHALLAAAAALWIEVSDITEVADLARELLSRHALSAGDALQLAAAMVVRKRTPDLQFVALDRQLAAAARAEGFSVLPA